MEDPVFTKVMQCAIMKEIWDKLKHIYERDENVKKENFHTFSGKFENLRMKEDENKESNILQVDEIVNTIKGLGVDLDEGAIV